LSFELFHKNQEIERLNKDIEWFKIQNLALANRPVTINNKNELMNQLSDQSQKIGVGRDLKIDANNSVVNLRDIIGQVTNTINQIPPSSESEKSEIKELLKELQTAVDDPELSETDKKEVLEQIQSLAEAAQDPKNETMQKKAKKAVGFLKVISEG
jgi:molecular chaperone DnaK (HSP70)